MSDLAMLRGHNGKVYRALAAANGAMVPKSVLINAMYGDREDGGPLNVDAVLRVVIYTLRKHGAEISAYGISGYLLGAKPDVVLGRQEVAVFRALKAAHGSVVPMSRLRFAIAQQSRAKDFQAVLRLVILRIRRKTGLDIRCVWGVGYYLASEHPALDVAA